MNKRALLAMAVAFVLVASCSGEGDAAPEPAISTSQIEQLAADADEFADIYWGSWPDVDEALARYAEDIVFYDAPDGDFTIEGADVMVPIIRGFARYYSDVNPQVEGRFVATDGAAYLVELGHGYWPPWSLEPDEHPPVVGLDIYHFDGELAVAYDIWFKDETLTMIEMGCFAIDECPMATDIANSYVRAWTSGDSGAIADIYADDAEFVDTILGINESGSDNISKLADRRFGSGAWDLEVVEVYAMTRGWRQPTENQPNQGDVIGIGINYRIVDDAGNTVINSLATFEMGTRELNGFTSHPEGLITYEEVFHDPGVWSEAAAIAAG